MAKDTTKNTLSFSTFFLNKYKKLEMGCTSYHNNIVWSRNGEEQARIDYDIKTTEEESYIHLKYKVRRRGEEEWWPIDYKIPLEAVRCHFGGKRWYFRCCLSKNGVYCGRRVAILYSAGDYFGCRHCADLTYDSCLVGQRIRGFPWKILTDTWKADEIYANLKLTHYNGKPTRKYKRCLKLWGSDTDVLKAEKHLTKRL